MIIPDIPDVSTGKCKSTIRGHTHDNADCKCEHHRQHGKWNVRGWRWSLMASSGRLQHYVPIKIITSQRVEAEAAASAIGMSKEQRRKVR